MARSTVRVCSVPGCGELTEGGGRCPAHRREAEQKRGSFRERGYDAGHARFRRGVLARDTVCVLCGRAKATDADHHPRDRTQLVVLGLDPNDPRHGRGLCHACHSRETARHQPGGWNS